jgi:hypothetical protein
MNEQHTPYLSEQKIPLSVIRSQPSIERKIEEHRIEIENKEMENNWMCMSRKFDKRCINYISQISIGLVVIFFSMYKLSTSKDCNEQSVYFSLLSGTVGFFMPSPSISR